MTRFRDAGRGARDRAGAGRRAVKDPGDPADTPREPPARPPRMRSRPRPAPAAVPPAPPATPSPPDALDPRARLEQARGEGLARARAARETGDRRALEGEGSRQPDGTGDAPRPVGERDLCRYQLAFERGWRDVEPGLAALAGVAAAHGGGPLPQALAASLARLERRLADVAFARGVLEAFCGRDPALILAEGATRGVTTSVVMPSCDGLERTRTALDALRRHADPGFPLEIVVVDNGSRDGSREWLAAQPDVTLVANATNEGAPRARNQGLRHVHGERVCFMDNDVVVTPGWLARLARHMELDPFAACVGPVCDRAAHGQEVAFDPARETPDARAAAIAAADPGGFRLASLLSSFLVLVRREALVAVGGFDERFSPWGFEDDDLTLRCVLAGWHNRVALDTFVRHASYGNDADRARRHAELLDANWRRFAEKWGLAEDARHGDYADLAPLLERDPLEARGDARIRVPVAIGRTDG